jgi:uncharacterized membrane protein (DUF373 family)
MSEPVDELPPDTEIAAARTNRVFLHVEFLVYATLGALLAVVAVASLIHAAIDGGIAILHWNETDAIFGVVDQLLFVLMLVEILHTVRVSIKSGVLTAEPFLVVGLIASIRRVLVITLESSNATKNGDWNPGIAGTFRASMTELGVLSVLIMVMVVSIYLVRRSGKAAEE